jgi:hypothetical protein
VLIAGAAIYASLNEPLADREAPLASRAVSEYANDDVVHERPLYVVHEMGTGPSIPFLPANQPQPKIVVPKGVYNFGKIGAQEVVTQTFVIRNTGEAPLTISRAYTTCGCTTAEISASVIPPGKVALATLRLDAGFHDVRGETVKRGLIIENNDRNKPNAEIWTRASVGRN